MDIFEDFEIIELCKLLAFRPNKSNKAVAPPRLIYYAYFIRLTRSQFPRDRLAADRSTRYSTLIRSRSANLLLCFEEGPWSRKAASPTPEFHLIGQQPRSTSVIFHQNSEKSGSRIAPIL